MEHVYVALYLFDLSECHETTIRHNNRKKITFHPLVVVDRRRRCRRLEH